MFGRQFYSALLAGFLLVGAYSLDEAAALRPRWQDGQESVQPAEQTGTGFSQLAISQQAYQAMKLGDFTLAESRFQKWIQASPQSTAAWLGLGRSSLAQALLLKASASDAVQWQGYLRNAEEALLEAKHLSPEDETVLYTLGCIQLELEKGGAARAQFEYLNQLRPKQPKILDKLAMSYIQSGQPQQGMNTLRLAEKYSKDPKAEAPTRLYFLAKAYFDLKQYQRSETILRFVLKEAPKFYQAQGLLGEVLLKQGQQKQAIQVWRAALVTKPGYVAVQKKLALLQQAPTAASGKTASEVAVVEVPVLKAWAPEPTSPLRLTSASLDKKQPNLEKENKPEPVNSKPRLKQWPLNQLSLKQSPFYAPLRQAMREDDLPQVHRITQQLFRERLGADEWLQLGEMLREWGDPRMALVAYRKALFQAENETGLVSEASQRIQRAEKQLLEVDRRVAALSKNKMTRNDNTLQNRHHGLNEILALNRRDLTLNWRLAESYEQLERYDEALKYYQRCQWLDPEAILLSGTHPKKLAQKIRQLSLKVSMAE